MDSKTLALATLIAPRIAEYVDYDLPDEAVISHFRVAIQAALINLLVAEEFRISGAMRGEVATQYELGRIL
jgi:hypothetical protein